jgi:hypothetical protein
VGVSAFHKSLWPEIIRRYKAGDEIKVIAGDLGVDRKTVYNVARRAGLPHRHTFDPARTKRIVGALHGIRLHGANAARAARILLASSAVSPQRKRRTLEQIAAVDA